MAAHFSGAKPEFSLVLGGPLYQLFRKAHLEGDATELLIRRMIFIPALAWLPLLILSFFGISTTVRPSFLGDFEVHTRFLIGLPVLILAEVIVHQRLTPAVRHFVERRIVRSEDLPRFYRAVDSAIKLRNSIPCELSLVILVYSLGMWLWNNRVIGSTTWFAVSGHWQLSPAGYWYVFISIPIAQFILLRWYWRLFIWYRFLWQVSRIDLNLIATHPDRCAGLAFLGKCSYAFGPILFAQGAALAGILAGRILYLGEALLSFKLQFMGFIAFFVLVVLGPLVMFTPALARAKRKGLAEYGQLAQDYVERFERKWLRHDSVPSEDLLGTGDIQSLADLGNSYSIVKEMRPIPFGLQDITRLAAATAAPFLPLLLTVFSLEEIITRVVKILF